MSDPKSARPFMMGAAADLGGSSGLKSMSGEELRIRNSPSSPPAGQPERPEESSWEQAFWKQATSLCMALERYVDLLADEQVLRAAEATDRFNAAEAEAERLRNLPRPPPPKDKGGVAMRGAGA